MAHAKTKLTFLSDFPEFGDVNLVKFITKQSHFHSLYSYMVLPGTMIDNESALKLFKEITTEEPTR